MLEITSEWCLYSTIGLIILNELIFVTAIIYYSWRVWRLRYDVFFQKRRPKFTLFSAVCFGVTPLMTPYQAFSYWCNNDPFWVRMTGYYFPFLATS